VRPAESRCPCFPGNRKCSRSKAGETGYSDCFRGGRPGRHGLCRDEWQCHVLIVPADRSCWQTTRTFARGCTCSSPVSDFGYCKPVTSLYMRDVEAAAGTLGLTVVTVEIRRMEDIAPGFRGG